MTVRIFGVLGNSTNMTYGLNNRFYAKRKLGSLSQAQEIFRDVDSPHVRATVGEENAVCTRFPARCKPGTMIDPLATR